MHRRQFNPKMKFLKLIAASYMLASFSTHPAQGAEIQLDKLGHINFRGEIKPGDAENLISKIQASRIVGKSGQGIYLNNALQIASPGGDLAEALKIAALVKAAYMTVWVGGEPGKTQSICASSCFFIFLSSYYRVAHGADIDYRGIDASEGIVGIHRPYLTGTSGGQASQAKQEEMMRAVRKILRDEGLNQRLVDEMMDHPSNDIYWLKDNDLRSVGQYRPSFEEELIQKCGYKRNTIEPIPGKVDLASWKKELQCTSAYEVETYNPVRQAVFEKLRTGWRPWQ